MINEIHEFEKRTHTHNCTLLSEPIKSGELSDSFVLIDNHTRMIYINAKVSEICMQKIKNTYCASNALYYIVVKL